MNKFTALSLLAVASSALAVPMAGAQMGHTGAYPTKASITYDINAVKGTAVGGAMSTPTAVPKKALFAGDQPDIVTITVINSYGGPITTSHTIATGAPTPISGDVGTGTMSDGETASFAVPTGWIGNIAVNDAQYEITNDVSLIEANFVIPWGGSEAQVNVDISYVDGYSVPMVCSCNDEVVTGCNLDLFSLSSCPDNDGQNACINPLRPDMSATAATPFFAPCQGMSYTFPMDSAADSTGACQDGHVTCCVGTACPANPKQQS